MENKYCVLDTISLGKSIDFIQPKKNPDVVRINNAAYDVLIDLHQTSPIIVSDNDCMFEARKEMEINSLRVALVVNDNAKLIGLLSLEDILSGETIKLIEKARVKRKAILVKHVMTSLDEVPAVNYDLLFHAKVGNIVATLQQAKSNYAVAVSNPNNEENKAIRGIFLASKISQQLGENIRATVSRANTILELQKALES